MTWQEEGVWCLTFRLAVSVCNTEANISDPRLPKAKVLNARSVLGMRNVGRGRNGLASFCGLMNMLSPVVPSSLRLTT